MTSVTPTEQELQTLLSAAVRTIADVLEYMESRGATDRKQELQDAEFCRATHKLLNSLDPTGTTRKPEPGK